jgi:16S rRNA (cytosine967-C5)-methyltransferase
MTRRGDADVLDARTAAFLTLLDVEQGLFPEDALGQYATSLKPKDRALTSALVYGVLRWQSRLDWVLRHFLKTPTKPLDPAVVIILRLGLFQLVYLDRVPESAAVDESVKLAKRFGPRYGPGLVNAILRSVTRTRELPDPAVARLPEENRLALTHAHPEWIVKQWIEQIGFIETESLLVANNSPPPLTVRVDLARIDRDTLTHALTSHGLRVEPTVYSPTGLIISGASGPIENLPGYHDGYFSVQDEAAQLIGFLATPRPGESVLDACAGRGGKSLHLGQMGARRLVAMDPDARRLSRIPAEAKRLNIRPPILLRGDLPAGPPFKPDCFDVVLVDAPCSNLGGIRRRPDVKWLKGPSDPDRLAQKQRRMLAAAADLIKAGGRLIFAVCTTTTVETSGVADAFLANHPAFRLSSAVKYLPASAHPLVALEGTIKTWPHRHGMDGHFAAVFKKTSALS